MLLESALTSPRPSHYNDQSVPCGNHCRSHIRRQEGLDPIVPPRAATGGLSHPGTQHAQAIAEAERALSLDPNFADAYTTLADILSFAGRPAETIRLVETAMHWAFPPVGPSATNWLRSQRSASGS